MKSFRGSLFGDLVAIRVVGAADVCKGEKFIEGVDLSGLVIFLSAVVERVIGVEKRVGRAVF